MMMDVRRSDQPPFPHRAARIAPLRDHEVSCAGTTRVTRKKGSDYRGSHDFDHLSSHAKYCEELFGVRQPGYRFSYVRKTL